MKMTSDSTLKARQKYEIVSFGQRLFDSRSGKNLTVRFLTVIKILFNTHTGWTVELQLLSTFRGISDILWCANGLEFLWHVYHICQ